MSSKGVVVPEFCAICEREKETKSNGVKRRNSRENHTISPREKEAKSLGQKYGNLPAHKHDDFLIQVTEPHWLRRGNLKPSDHVCKRHLAILMRGVDRGCEGGCCSPLHRGARLCKPQNLKSIPPAWRSRFVKHPKIKEEDKSLMLLCWGCYKKHMDRMSKYGDPMGRTFGARHGLQRSKSLIDTDSGPAILDAMKRYRSMDKLDSELPHNYHTNGSRRYSVNSITSHQSGEDSLGNSPDPPLEMESKVSPSRRISRGRKFNKERRSPSPPNNISPVRTSVHSRRKHSPHKRSKSPISQVPKTSTITPGSNRGPEILSTKNVNPNQQVENADKIQSGEETPRPPPVPPVGLFSPRSDRSEDIIDVFGTRRSTSPERSPEEPQHSSPKSHLTVELSKGNPPTHFTRHANILSCADVSHKNVNMSGVVIESPKSEEMTDIKDTEALTESNQAEESITSAEEMAGIFGDDSESNVSEMSYECSNGITPQNDSQTMDVETVSPEDLCINHKHESSGSSSDRTGETQITVEAFMKNKRVDIVSNDVFENGTDDGMDDEDDVSEAPEYEIDESKTEEIEKVEISVQTPETSFSVSDMRESVFVSPRRRIDPEGSSSITSSPVLNYSLSPQSFRRLGSIKLSYNEISNEEGEESDSTYQGEVREFLHPLRNQVMVKIPRSIGKMAGKSFVKVVAEDVEIFPETMSFLDGITQSIGEDMSMYAKGDIQIVRLDLLLNQNKSSHRTLGFVNEQLVVRRGQAFELNIELSEPYEQRKHSVMVELMTGSQPRASNGTHIFLPVLLTELPTGNYGFNEGGSWSARLEKSEGKVLTISVNPPPKCPIGSYSICFQIEKDDKRSRWTPGCEDNSNIFVLFNPWCIDDAVFMSSEADRLEYALSDTGFIYAGNRTSLQILPWIFGQYEEDVLHACMALLDQCNLATSERADPVSVTRGIANIVSHHLTDARLTQSANYSSCSADVLRRYLDTGNLTIANRNVTLCGLLVTVLRCLGFPTRPVTCFDCAVDTDIPMTINRHYSEDGQALDYLNSDKLWPAFSWADVWMSRVDLPPGFGGWQAIHLSSHPRKTPGPTPAYAIKKGHTSYCEAEMYFKSLNADKNHWVVSKDGRMQLIRTEKNKCGSLIVTKSVGNSEPQDITKLYKFPEGCEENKLAIHAAHMHCGNNVTYDETSNDEILMSITTHPDVIKFGNDLDVVTKIVNNGSKVYHLTININGAILSEDGDTVMNMIQETILAEVLKGEKVEVPVKINLSPYLHKLTGERNLAFTAFATVRELPDLRLVCSHLAGIKYPDVEIQLHGEFKEGGEVTVSSRMRNPLSYFLKNARIFLSASGLIPLNVPSKYGKSVGPWGVFKSEKVYRCQRAGKHTIVARFTSDHVTGPVGVQDISIDE